ncbi:MAG: hypothetical protein M0Z91_06660 [Actinomycetota bacterium]|nr:hypothetical protein [Actinomycetota bacterium]
MKTCQSCGLPAAVSMTRCAFCGKELQGAGTYELTPHSTHFAFSAPGAALADARLERGVWRIYERGSSEPRLSLLPMLRQGRYSVALLDEGMARAATVVVRTRVEPGAPERLLAAVNDDVRTSMVIYTDGPTGLHMVNRLGDVVALASPRAGGAMAGLDIASMGSDRLAAPAQLFGIFLSLILARVAHPGCTFTDLDHICLDASSES